MPPSMRAQGPLDNEKRDPVSVGAVTDGEGSEISEGTGYPGGLRGRLIWDSGVSVAERWGGFQGMRGL